MGSMVEVVCGLGEGAGTSEVWVCQGWVLGGELCDYCLSHMIKLNCNFKSSLGFIQHII